MPLQSVFYGVVVLLASAGFLIATYIRHKKTTAAPLVCPIGHTCDEVVHSDYSRFFGIPIELLGMAYYAFIAFSYGVMMVRPELAFPLVTFLLLMLSTVGFLFSLYLTFIQAFALRAWCTWCLISAALCTLIFSFVLLGSEYGFLLLLAEHRALFAALHLFGIALGLGGATISDLLFFRFLRDLRISEVESGVLHTLSQVIWFGLAVLVLSGLGLYLPNMEVLNASAKFLMKMVVVTVILVNGAFLNLYIAPKLIRISFGRDEGMSLPLHHARKVAFAMGAISLISWYSALVLGLLRSSPLSFWTLLSAYAGLLALGIAAGLFMERRMGSRSMSGENTPAAP
jgi:uncharacterized membrane protein